MAKKLEEYQNIEIALALDQGKAIASLAEQFEVSPQYIRKIGIEAGLLEKKAAPKKKAKQSKEDQETIISRVLDGEDLEAIALDFNISINTIKQLCKREEVTIPRTMDQLTRSEFQEVEMLLLNNESLEEIALAYNIAIRSLEALHNEGYKDLDAEALGFLYEAIREKPDVTPAMLKRMAKDDDLDIPGDAILSYLLRLRRLKQ